MTRINQLQERRYSRVQFFRRVTLHFPKKNYGPCSVRDLSLGGMFVSGNIQEETGTACRLTFIQTGPGSDFLLRACARVARSEKDGVAVEFTSMTFDCYMFLQASLLYESDDPLSMCMEFTDDTPFKLTEFSTCISNQ